MWSVFAKLRSSQPSKPLTHNIGERGEEIACNLLKKKGYRILGRNLPLRFTEIDILAEAVDRDTVVLVEVKTRTRRLDTGPDAADKESLAAEFAVDQHKRDLLVKAARKLASANDWHKRPLRIDVIAVELSDDPAACIVRHREDVVK